MKRNKDRNDFLRINILQISFSLVCFLFISRLFFIQVLEHSKYRVQASEQYWNLQDIPAKRGNIYSKEGSLLATTQDHYLMYIQPQVVENKKDTTNALLDLVSETWDVSDPKKSEEFRKISQERYDSIINSQLFWAVLEHNITPPLKEKIAEKNINGIGFETEPVRYYTENSLASHLLGFVARNDKGDKQGYYGVEGRFDGDLRGKAGRIVEEKDATGSPILVGGYKKVEPINGRDIVLTINRSVQYLVEKILKEGVEKYNASSGSVVVMDPHTGEIIALANYPTYDPAKFNDALIESSESTHRKSIERRNLAISETYEPGSVIKPLTVASALDLQRISLTSTYEDNGPVQYSGYWINNWDGKHYGTMTISQLLQKSNNIGAAWVGHRVGSKDLSNYFRNFGLGDRLGVDLEGEDTGILRDYKTWTDIDLANISFGQGMSATPLQVLNAFNALANGGVLMQPKIIHKIVDNKKEIYLPNKKIRQVISSQTSEMMTNLLYEAVSGGESKYFNLKNYKIGGKTGTAQIPINGSYDPQKTNVTFVGFLKESKKFSMIVRLDRPESSIYAAETAVPLWMTLADELIKYYGIPPDITIN